MQTLLRLTAVAAAATIGLVACGSDDDGRSGASADVVAFNDVWSRRPVAGQTTGAVYGIVSNGGDNAITVVGATASVTDQVELHEVVMNDDGTMTMQEMGGGFVIPANDAMILQPGSFHIMLLDIDPATYPDEVEVTLEFDDGTTLEKTAPVREIEGMDEMNDGEMEMDDGAMDETESDG